MDRDEDTLDQVHEHEHDHTIHSYGMGLSDQAIKQYGLNDELGLQMGPIAHGLVMPTTEPGYVRALFGEDNPIWSNTGTYEFGKSINVGFTFEDVSWGNYYNYAAEQRFDAAQEAAARAAMQLWANVAKINFTETDGVSAKFAFREYDLPGAAGIALPWSMGNHLYRSEVTVDNAQGGFNPNEYGFKVLLHEIAHGLGIKHPGNYNGSNGTADAPYLTDFGLPDNRDLTVMSYYNGNYNYASTPMLFDIAVIQKLYGANASYNSGNNTYTLDTAFKSHTRWDGGGTDTLNSSAVASNVTLDLREGIGNISHVGSNHSWNAFGANIENAIAGNGADTLYGNLLNNQLTGGSGNDTLEGGTGNDTLTGGVGTDAYRFTASDGTDIVDDSDGTGSITIDGKTLTGTASAMSGFYKLLVGGTQFILTPSGADMVVTGFGSGQVTLKNFVSGKFGIALSGSSGGGGGGGNTPVNFKGTVASETATGGSAADNFKGNGGADTLTGGAGNDTILNDGAGSRLYGEAGDDKITGKGAASIMDGGADNDTITGNGASSTLIGGIGSDTVKSTGTGVSIDGGDGDDVLTGSGANATMIGGNGNDAMKGGTSANIAGGEGNDNIQAGAGSVINAGNGADTIKLTGSGTVNGQGGQDTITVTGASTVNGNDGADNIKGSSANDTLNGDLDNDTIAGGNGADNISGGDGLDHLTGASGNDTMNGDAGNDMLYGVNDADQLAGGDGSDLLDGGNGTDVLGGGAGDDTLFGGKDNDTLTGGADADRFQFGSNQGTETIMDFQVGVDKLQYIGGSVSDALMLQSGIVTDLGSDLKFVIFKTTIILKGVDDISDLAGVDFIL